MLTLPTGATPKTSSPASANALLMASTANCVAFFLRGFFFSPAAALAAPKLDAAPLPSVYDTYSMYNSSASNI